jgi:hypothetical protein
MKSYPLDDNDPEHRRRQIAQALGLTADKASYRSPQSRKMGAHYWPD